MFLTISPELTKRNCEHTFEKKFEQGSCKCFSVCSKCGTRKKINPINEKLYKYFSPAFKQSEDFYWTFQFNTNWDTIQYDGFRLPATEDAHDWCGLWQTKGCLNEKEHRRLGFKNKIFVKQYQRSCFRAVCKVCFKKWMGRQSNKATRRIEKFENNSENKPKHIILSVPHWEYNLSVKELRKKSYSILKDLGCIGGTFIFHPFRFDKTQRRWYYSPHFHIVGFLRIRISKICKINGWIIKDVGFRKSIFQTFYYLLSHSGVRRGYHTLIWFGDLSYSKLKLEKEPDSTICPLCSQKLVPIYHEGEHSGIPPDEIFEGFVNSGEWYEVKTIPSSEWTHLERYEYSLNLALADANKGIRF